MERAKQSQARWRSSQGRWRCSPFCSTQADEQFPSSCCIRIDFPIRIIEEYRGRLFEGEIRRVMAVFKVDVFINSSSVDPDAVEGR